MTHTTVFDQNKPVFHNLNAILNPEPLTIKIAKNFNRHRFLEVSF